MRSVGNAGLRVALFVEWPNKNTLLRQSTNYGELSALISVQSPDRRRHGSCSAPEWTAINRCDHLNRQQAERKSLNLHELAGEGKSGAGNWSSRRTS